MNKTGTILKALQAVLLVTVLTPAISHADPLSTRMMLAQAQTQSQDQAVKGEVKKMNRGLILGTAEAATNPNLQRPVEIPQVTAPVTTAAVASTPVATVEAPQIEIPALPPRNDDAPVAHNTFSTAAVAATATSTPSVVTLPAPQPVTDAAPAVTTQAPSTTDIATTPAPVTPVAPATAVSTPTPVTATAATTTTDTVKTDTAKADATTAKPTSTKTAHASHPHHSRDDSVNVGGVKLNAGNLGGQISNIMSRSDVKSILSQYGLN